MRVIFGIVLLSLLLSESAIGQIRAYQSSNDKDTVDSLLTSKILFLKHCLKNRETLKVTETNRDSLREVFEKEMEIVDLFELLTGLKGLRIHHYAYGKDYRMSHVQRWENWIAKNRTLVIWESDNKRLNRNDVSIYHN